MDLTHLIVSSIAYNILRLAQIRNKLSLPMTEMMDLLCDDEVLLEKYIFQEIESFYERRYLNHIRFQKRCKWASLSYCAHFFKNQSRRQKNE